MKRHLVVIDPQRDFCKPDGALYVQGADDDMRRLAACIEREGESFEAIHVTLDSHQWIHIAHPIFWTNDAGESPAPFTEIKEGNGVWRARDPKLASYAESYIQTLAEGGRYGLTIWPPHCIIGTPGHAVHDELAVALRRWSEAQMKPIGFVSKGSNVKTEHYSAIRADVLDSSDPSTDVNRTFIARLEEADDLVFAGEALDYCLLNTIRDLVESSPGLPSKITILRDASSSISGCTIEDHKFFKSLMANGAKSAATQR